MPRTLRVESTAGSGEVLLSVTMQATQDEIAALGIAPEELELFIFGEAPGGSSKRWLPAGKFLGAVPSTRIAGDSGVEERADGTVEYWTVGVGSGVFAIGHGEGEDQSDGSARPGPQACGAAMIHMFLCCIMVLGLKAGTGGTRRA